jgi:hypothetical protein
MYALRLLNLVSFALLAVVTGRAQEPTRTITNADIINLVRAGIGDSTIILTIQKAPSHFDTSTEALIQLKTAGVSDAVLNVILTASPANPSTAPPAQEDCSQLLDNVLASIGSREKIVSVNSSSYKDTTVVKEGNTVNTYQLNRVIVWTGSVHISRRSTSGPETTVVITPEFNYFESGKMTTAVPASILEYVQTSMGLDLIFIAQHRGDYSCIRGEPAAVGNIRSATLKIKSSAVEGVMNVDPATGRLLRTLYQNGTSGEVVTDFSDWRMIDDVSIAFKRRISDKNSITDLTIGEYQVNPVVPVSLFQPPPGKVSTSVTLKVLQAESTPYTVETNGGISTSCNISGSTNTSITASTYGNTTSGNATATSEARMNCTSSDNTIRWTHVLNAMFVQASDGNSYIIACDRAWAWSKCRPLRAGDTFLATQGDKGFVVQSFNGKSKEQEAIYRVLQSRMRDQH